MLVILNENQLDDWVRSSALLAQGVIVELVYRLIYSSIPQPKDIRFPLGDSIGQHGVDGFLDTDFGFDPFVPTGKSYWEIGTGLNANDKANKDYDTLTGAVPKTERDESVFIFITPLSGRRDWEYTWKEEGQKKWIENKKALKEWKDVKIIDGSVLIDWLHHSPAIEIWLASKLFSNPNLDLNIPELHWDIIKTYGAPPELIPLLFLSNRDQALSKLRELFSGSIILLQIKTCYQQQFLDFVTATIMSLEDTIRENVITRCLIINDKKTWVQIVSHYRNFILIANFDIDEAETAIIQQARNNGHSIIYHAPPGGVPNLHSVNLLKPKPNQITEALVKSGYSHERARVLSNRSDGNLTTLINYLQTLSILPFWAKISISSDLAIAEVLGSWQEDNNDDIKEVKKLSGKDYGEWIGSMKDFTINQDTPLIHRDNKWKFTSRYEGWFALGGRITDELLIKFKIIALEVLTEVDPRFELSPENQFASNIFGKNTRFSYSLRKGLSETLALLGSYPKAIDSVNSGFAENLASSIVKEILSSSDWQLWASLSMFMPLFAEASPNEFLKAIENACNNQTNLFNNIFSQENTNINYMTGVLWALESLAWSADYFTRAVIVLGKLALIDPGGSWANRPINSLKTILLPWFPQTTASFDKKISSIKNLINEAPNIAWNLILSLLRNSQQMTIGSYKPNWREWIPDDWEDGVSKQDYFKQIQAIEEIALIEVKKDIRKLIDLIDRFNELLPQSQNEILHYIQSEKIISLKDEEKYIMWKAVIDFVSKHKKYSEAVWSMKEDELEKINEIADRIKPSFFYQHQRLFIENDFSLFEETDHFEEQTKLLQKKRQNAIHDILNIEGIKGIIRFARSVESSWAVGYILGFSLEIDVDHDILPTLLESNEASVKQFIGGYIKGKIQKLGWDWVDKIEITNWSNQQKSSFFLFLPFSEKNWKLLTKFDKEVFKSYWENVNVFPHESEGKLDFAIETLLNYERSFEALYCLHFLLIKKLPIKQEHAKVGLYQILRKQSFNKPMDSHIITEIIRYLQNNPDIELNDMIRIEWAYLPLLNRYNGSYPKTIEMQLAKDPNFFCEIIQKVYKSNYKDICDEENSEKSETIASNGFRLLDDWNLTPGMKDDGIFDGNFLKLWFEKVKTICEESGHLESAYFRIGHVLFYAPADPDGLWIHKSALEILNLTDGNQIRDGFTNALINSRGVFYVSGGKEEKKLAEKYMQYAKDADENGFFRFAESLRNISNFYLKEAERDEKRAQEEE